MTVLFVQGAGEGTHESWDNKLVAHLERTLGPGYTVVYPRMPDEANPAPVAWKLAIDRELRALTGEFILVGHSVGGAILIDYLADGHQQQPLLASSSSPRHLVFGPLAHAPATVDRYAGSVV